MHPNVSTPRKHFFGKIIEEESSSLPIIWGGDFNFVENPHLDKLGTPQIPAHTAGNIVTQIFKNNHKLRDSFRVQHPDRKEYTYTLKAHLSAKGDFYRSRIDRIYIPTTHIRNMFTKIIPNPFSDHSLVTCSFEPPKKDQHFRRGVGGLEIQYQTSQ